MSEAHRLAISVSNRLAYFRDPTLRARRLASALRGKNHPQWGKPPHPGAGFGIRCLTDRGETVRSTWEKYLADRLHSEGSSYDYEPKRFELPTGESYTPDFWIPDLNMYVEVKGRPELAWKYRAMRSVGQRIMLLDGPKYNELRRYSGKAIDLLALWTGEI